MSPRGSWGRWLSGAVSLAAALGIMAAGRSPAAGPERGRTRGEAGVRRAAFQAEGPALEGIDLGTDWINAPGPIRARDLRGKVVVLDFWTFCCINCHHVLPDLAMLEDKYRNELVVIGVHTPKFEAEKDTDNLRNKVREYRIRHPVVNDANQAIWNHFGVTGWPTLAVFGPDGRLVYAESGEGQFKKLDKVIGDLVRAHRARGDLDESPVRYAPEAEKPHEGPLHFPGKVLADPAGKRLFISDTGNNRIVVADLGGKLLATIGNGAAGLHDGSYDRATFNRPQGLYLHEGTLYVADTENHAIRAVHFKDEQVRTVAGNGKQAHARRGGAPREAGLNSPWDVLGLPDSKVLYIAMAGPHQIWKVDLGAEPPTVGPWAGTGVEGIKDGTLETADFAQPSGLATDGKHLFVADSETSSIRAIAIHPAPGKRVQTIVGQGLFVFGDVDGEGARVRLQHCLGLAYGEGRLYVADTYNNKIKVCDTKDRKVEALVGSPHGEAGATDSPPLFNQPGGLSLLDKSTLYVADTDNHKVRVVDLSSKKVRTLAIEGLTSPKPPAGPPRFLNRTPLAAPAAKVAPGSKVVLDVKLTLPPDTKLNAETAMPYLVESPRRPDALAPGSSPASGRISPPSTSFQVAVPLAEEAKAGDHLELKLSVSTFQCRGGSEGFCTIKSFVWTVPLTFAADAPDRVRLTNAEATASK